VFTSSSSLEEKCAGLAFFDPDLGVDERSRFLVAGVVRVFLDAAAAVDGAGVRGVRGRLAAGLDADVDGFGDGCGERCDGCGAGSGVGVFWRSNTGDTLRERGDGLRAFLRFFTSPRVFLFTLLTLRGMLIVELLKCVDTYYTGNCVELLALSRPPELL